MSLGKNILASYFSQIYGLLLGVLMMPLYLQYMGAEALGLIGFFLMLQTWFLLLDMGLSPTMARETARFNGGATDALSLRRLLRAMEGLFIGVALLSAAAMMLGADTLAHHWLQVRELPLPEVRLALMLMAVIVALRWIGGIYRGAIRGLERMVWLSGFNMVVSTARFVLVIPLFLLVGTQPSQFFAYQLLVAALELAALVWQTYRLIPTPAHTPTIAWHWAPLRPVLKFALSIAFTSSAWMLVTQTDKLLLSKLLPLGDYAYFTLAVLLASGVTLLSDPISSTLMPRMAKLAAQGDEVGLMRLYRQATQGVAVIVFALTAVLATFSEQVLWAWTGNAALTAQAAPVLTLYVLGNGIVGVSAFPYYLQFARGDLKLHFIGNLWFTALFVPALIWATLRYGMVGAGWAWLISNAALLLLWTPVVHARIAPGLHGPWLLRDVAPIALSAAAGAALAHAFVPWPTERLAAILVLGAIFMGLLLTTALSASAVRHRLAQVRGASA